MLAEAQNCLQASAVNQSLPIFLNSEGHFPGEGRTKPKTKPKQAKTQKAKIEIESTVGPLFIIPWLIEW